MIIHLGTRIEAVFGKLDEQGNVVEQFPVGVSTPYLSEEAFGAVREHILSEKAKLEPAAIFAPEEIHDADSAVQS